MASKPLLWSTQMKTAVMETLVVPIRNSNAFLIDAYERLLRLPQIQLIPISQTILIEAARLGATTLSLRTPDAIHAATVIAAGCTQFLTNDRQLRAVTGLPIVILDDVLTL